MKDKICTMIIPFLGDGKALLSDRESCDPRYQMVFLGRSVPSQREPDQMLVKLATIN